MAEAVVRLSGNLRSFFGGRTTVTVEAASVRAALAEVTGQAEGLADRLFLPSGALRRHINVYLGETDVRSLDGLDTSLTERAVLSVIQAFAGG